LLVVLVVVPVSTVQVMLMTLYDTVVLAPMEAVTVLVDTTILTFGITRLLVIQTQVLVVVQEHLMDLLGTTRIQMEEVVTRETVPMGQTV
jgi:hypothetical protein